MNINELHPTDEIKALIAFRNAIFGTLSMERWQAMTCTAAVAREDDGRILGFIPLQFREQILRPGLTIPVVYENAVGVAGGQRGRGIGSQMIEASAQFMADRVAALFVIRGGERTPGYRFYRKTGHSDLCYCRDYVFSSPSAMEQGGDVGAAVEMLDWSAWQAIEPELLALSEQQFALYGGGRLREPGYWKMIADSHVYGAWPWSLLTLRRGGCLAGYLVGVPGARTESPEFRVYEVVGKDDDALCQLLTLATTLSENGSLIVTHLSLDNPLGILLRQMGFEERDSRPQIMARILRPDLIWPKLAAASGLLESVTLRVNTPHRADIVCAPERGYHDVLLECKENILARLFTCRLDLAAAVQVGLVRWNVHDPGLARDLCAVFQFCPWVQWFTDYV